MQNAFYWRGAILCYVDYAFVIRPWMQVGYAQRLAGSYESMYNAAMSSSREAVEWSYKNLKQHFASHGFKRLLKVRKLPIALIYRAKAILSHMKVCISYGARQVDTYFKCTPLTLDQ